MNIAFIPVRGGSKSIPMKNIKEICGKPLVYWTVCAACKCNQIDRVYVATDSDKIKETVESFSRYFGDEYKKLEVINRSAESALDTASTETAMLEFAEKYEFENIVLIQATSPLLTEEDLSKGLKIYETQGVDSVLSAVKQKRFIWNENECGYAKADNYDYLHRPRRQEFDGYFVENGAFYITSRKRLLETGNRISGNIKICEMNESSYYEIDEPLDWMIIEKLLQRREKKNEMPKQLDKDCDSLLTD